MKPGGYFIYSTVSLDGDNVMTKWMGRDMYCSSFSHLVPPPTSPSRAAAEVNAAGFDVVKCEETTFTGASSQLGWGEQVVDEPHVFVYARKSGGK